MREEFTATQDDETKANLMFFGIVGLYFFLVFIAFLCTDGRKKYIIPLLRKWWPTHGLVNEFDQQVLDQKSKIYLFDEAYRHLNFVIRKAKRDGIIYRWKVKNGVSYVQVYEDDDFVEIHDINELGSLGVKIPQDYNKQSIGTAHI